MIENSIFPCIWFNDDGNEAAAFYCRIFGGTITTDSPVVLNFDLFGQRIMILNAGPQFQRNDSFGFTVLCNNSEEMMRYVGLLSENSPDFLPLFEGDCCTVRDQFGISWSLLLDGRNGAQKIIPTLIFGNQNFNNAEIAGLRYTSIFKSEDKTETENLNRNKEEIFPRGNVAKLNDYKILCRKTDSSENNHFTEAFSLVVLTDDQAKTDYLWESLLANGGRASMCGWLKDEFGVSWQIVPRRLLELMNDLEEPEKAQRVVQAMMTMQKIEIHELEAAYNA